MFATKTTQIQAICPTLQYEFLYHYIHVLIFVASKPWALAYTHHRDLHMVRARPLTLHPHLHLHLHFYIRDAYANVGKCPTQPGITQMWMKKFPEGVKLHAFPRFMQGAYYQLKTNNFRKVLEIIG
jgi:hypothetical protein